MASADPIPYHGAKPVTVEELTAFQVPSSKGRRFPPTRGRVFSVVAEPLGEAGYAIKKRWLGVLRDGSRFFGTLDLKSPIAGGIRLAVGVRW